MGEELHANHRKRMRDKLAMHGGAAFNDHELLEMLLFNAIPRQNTNPLAHTLINTFGSLEKVINAPIEALLSVDGVGKQTAVYITLLKETIKRVHTNMEDVPLKIMDAQRAMEIIMPEYENIIGERVFLLALDKNSEICYKGFLSEGSNNEVECRIREIINKCVPVNAVMYYLAHNHPSGIATPSWTDIKNSVISENILTPMNLLLMDHFVIADDDYVSMKDSGMLMRQMDMSQIVEVLAGN